MKAPGILGLVLAALGGCCPYTPSECVAVIENACVVLDVEDPAAVTAEDLARLDAALVAGGRFWGVDPAHVLRGWTIVLHGSRDVCGVSGASGCCTRECHRIDLGADDEPGCIEWAAIHELGHAVIHDGDHTDPRWSKECPMCFGTSYCGP